MRSDCPSSPTRGSRFVGLLSITITSILGLGACEQERSGKVPATIVAHTIGIAKKLVILREAKDLLFARSPGAASRIGDLSQDRRPFRSRGRGHTAWPTMPGLVRKDGESNRLFSFRWNT